MSTIISTLQDNDGNIVLPRTVSNAITMADGTTQLEQALANKESVLGFTPININQTTPQTFVGRFIFPSITVDTNSFYVDSVNHRIGIGTTTPTQKLQVVNGNTLLSNDISSATEAPLIVQNMQAYGSPYTQYIQMWKNNVGTIMANIRADGTLTLNGSLRTNNVSYNSGVVAIGLVTDELLLSSKANNANIVITPNGTGKIVLNNNVGIGTTSPTSKLEIKNNVADSSIALIVNQHNLSSTGNILDLQFNGVTQTSIDKDGKIQMGTSSGHYIDISKTVNDQANYGMRIAMNASTLQADSASTGNDETFTNTHYAWKFVASASHTLGSIGIRLKKIGTVTNTTETIAVKIFSDNAGTPDALLYTSDAMRMGSLTTSYAEYLFGGDYTLTSGVTYWISISKTVAVNGGGSIVIDRNGTALTTCNTSAPVMADWTVNAGLGRFIIYGQSPRGIHAISTNRYAIAGVSTNSSGIYGYSTNYFGIYGNSQTSNGIYGNSTYGNGIQGNSNYGYGIYGISNSNYGVFGSSTSGYGVCGQSDSNIGTIGISTNNYGVMGTSTNSTGIRGVSKTGSGGLIQQTGVADINIIANLLRIERLSSGIGFNTTGNMINILDNPTVTGTISGALISGTIGSTERFRIDSRVLDGASSVVGFIDSNVALVNATAKLFSFRNNGIEKTSILADGGVQSSKFSINSTGGYMIRLTNKSGAPSIKGTVVMISDTTDNATKVNAIDSDMPIGICYEDGIADGSEMWVVVSGIAEVLLVNSVATTRGYVAYSSGSVAGRIDTAVTVPASTIHFREIGHTIESKIAGTNVLCKCIVHFN